MKRIFNMWIDTEDIDELREVATSKGLSVAAMIRMIVKEYIDAYKARKGS